MIPRRLLDLLLKGSRAITPPQPEDPRIVEARNRLKVAQTGFYHAVSGVIIENERLRRLRDSRHAHKNT